MKPTVKTKRVFYVKIFDVAGRQQQAELIGVARRDDTVESRVAATQALAAFGVARVETVLDEIAATDPDQNVRYSAQKILLEYRQERELEAQRPRLDETSN